MKWRLRIKIRYIPAFLMVFAFVGDTELQAVGQEGTRKDDVGTMCPDLAIENSHSVVTTGMHHNCARSNFGPWPEGHTSCVVCRVNFSATGTPT